MCFGSKGTTDEREQRRGNTIQETEVVVLIDYIQKASLQFLQNRGRLDVGASRNRSAFRSLDFKSLHFFHNPA